MKGRLLFVNKKKQKNFIYSGAWALSATQTQAQLSQKFLRRFFQKAAAFPAASNGAAFSRISAYSAAGSLSHTIPPPAWA